MLVKIKEFNLVELNNTNNANDVIDIDNINSKNQSTIPVKTENNNNKIIVLLGESASGKSTIQKRLIQFGYKPILQYTTRPMRDNEIAGTDYHFISDEEFNLLKSQNYFAEVSEFRGWQYGSAKKDYISDTPSVIVLNPQGLRQLKRNNINVSSFYIKVSRRERLIRQLLRGDNIDEAIRRNYSDVGQFIGIEDEVNYVVECETNDCVVDVMAEIIKSNNN